MCNCDKGINYVCTSCFIAIKRDARENPMSGVRGRHGEWKCDAVFSTQEQRITHTKYTTDRKN
jgi:hypothetical protein